MFMAELFKIAKIWKQPKFSCLSCLCCPIDCGIFQSRDRTHVPCIDRWILNHWTTREALS